MIRLWHSQQLHHDPWSVYTPHGDMNRHKTALSAWPVRNYYDFIVVMFVRHTHFCVFFVGMRTIVIVVRRVRFWLTNDVHRFHIPFIRIHFDVIDNIHGRSIFLDVSSSSWWNEHANDNRTRHGETRSHYERMFFFLFSQPDAFEVATIIRL